MDPLSDVLAMLKPADFGFRGLDGAGEWALRFGPSDGIKAFAVERGTCRMTLEDDGESLVVGPGDLILLPGRTAFTLHTSDGVGPRDASEFFLEVPVGTTNSLNGGGECFGIGGFFRFEGPHADHLLRVLPRFVHLRADGTGAALVFLIERLMRELREPRPGGRLIASHLAQLLLVEALRLHLASGGGGRGWLAALGDERMRVALAAMHAGPARPWTLASLAREAAMSRSGFAVRFREVTGEPALAYLTRWRMLLAADRLAGGRETLATVAAAVGYGSEAAFGIAFKRVTGTSPRRFARETARAGAAGGPAGGRLEEGRVG